MTVAGNGTSLPTRGGVSFIFCPEISSGGGARNAARGGRKAPLRRQVALAPRSRQEWVVRGTRTPQGRETGRGTNRGLGHA